MCVRCVRSSKYYWFHHIYSVVVHFAEDGVSVLIWKAVWEVGDLLGKSDDLLGWRGWVLANLICIVVVPGVVFVLDVCVAEPLMGEQFQVSFRKGHLLDRFKRIFSFILVCLGSLYLLHHRVIRVYDLLWNFLWFLRLFVLIIAIDSF